MGRSFSPAHDDIAAGTSRFFHKASNRWYTLYRRDGSAYLRRHQAGADGAEINVVEARVDYIIGSGNHARGLLHRAPDGRLMQLPIAWYAEDAAWDMAPGYDRQHHADFRRAADGACLFCHNAYPAGAVREAAGEDPVFPPELPQGIDCQRCHGRGDDHVQAAQSGAAGARIRAAILNPARLPPERQMEICMQCHLQPSSRLAASLSRRAGRAVFSYDPRQPLGSYMTFFDRAAPAESFEVNHTAYRLRQSACFRASGGRLVCTTCHDPHGPARAEAAERACRGCHASLPRAHTADVRCAACHMPKRRTEDAVHVVMTDHRIGRRPAVGDPLRHFVEAAEDSWEGAVSLYYPSDAQPAAPAKRVPRTVERLNYAGEAYQRAGELARSESVLRNAIALAPELPEPQLNLGVTLSRMGRWDAAADAFREAIRLAPDLAAAHNNLAYLLGPSREAELHFAEAIRIDPKYWAAHLGYARLLMAAGRREEAAAHFREAAHSPEGSIRREALQGLGSR